MKILGKYYLTDHGFHHGLIEENILKVTKILENIVFIELLRRGYEVNVGRNKDKSEVDFVCKKSGKYKYIQVSYRLTNEKTGSILDDHAVPYFKDNNWNDGIRNTFDTILNEVCKEYNITINGNIEN